MRPDTAVVIDYTRVFLTPEESRMFIDALDTSVAGGDSTPVTRLIRNHVTAATTAKGRPLSIDQSDVRGQGTRIRDAVDHARYGAVAPAYTVDVAQVSHAGASSTYMSVVDGCVVPTRRLMCSFDAQVRTAGHVVLSAMTRTCAQAGAVVGDHVDMFTGDMAELRTAAVCPACADVVYTGLGIGDVDIDFEVTTSGFVVTDRYAGTAVMPDGDEDVDVAYCTWDDPLWSQTGQVGGVDATSDLLALDIPRVLTSTITLTEATDS